MSLLAFCVCMYVCICPRGVPGGSPGSPGRDPGSTQGVPGESQGTPQGVLGDPGESPRAPRRAPDGSRRHPKESPGSPRRPPRWLQGHPSAPQGAPWVCQGIADETRKPGCMVFTMVSKGPLGVPTRNIAKHGVKWRHRPGIDGICNG